MTSKPISATPSRRLAAVLKLPEVTLPVLASRVAPSERGKNSYQLPKSARGAVGERRERALDGDQVTDRVAREHDLELVGPQDGEPGARRAHRCRRPRSMAAWTVLCSGVAAWSAPPRPSRAGAGLR